MRKIASCLCLLALAGCAMKTPGDVTMYEGPRDVNREVRVEARAVSGQLHILKVDGKPVISGVDSLLSRPANVVYVLPGRHFLNATWSSDGNRSMSFSPDLAFVAEPGKAYFVRAEVASSGGVFTAGTVRFWIEDASGRRTGADASAPPANVANVPASAALPPRPSGCRQLSFTDGSSACMEDFEPLSVKIGMPAGLSVLDRSTAARTMAFSITQSGPGCMATFWAAWNNPNGADDERARQGCETLVKKDTRNLDGCRCVVIVPADSNVPMTQKEFVAKIFRHYYLLLDSYRASKQYQSQSDEIDNLKRTLQARERAHDQRLAGATGR